MTKQSISEVVKKVNLEKHIFSLYNQQKIEYSEFAEMSMTQYIKKRYKSLKRELYKGYKQITYKEETKIANVNVKAPTDQQ